MSHAARAMTMAQRESPFSFTLSLVLEAAYALKLHGAGLM
jgi:hypothetical protein